MAPTTDDDRYEKARQRVEAKMGFFTHLFVFIVINVVFIIIAGEDWLWVTLVWGIGLALHAFSTFFGDSDAMTKWKERQIQRELERQEGTPAGGATAAGTEPTAPRPTEPTSSTDPTQPIEPTDS